MKSKRTKKSESAKSAASAGPSEPAVPGTPWWAHAAVVLGLLLANLALYHGTIGLGFLSVDDPDYVQNNPYIESFSAANLKHILTTPYTANYAPANLLELRAGRGAGQGQERAAIHLSNVLWHGWVVCMVYLLAFTIRPRVPDRGRGCAAVPAAPGPRRSGGLDFQPQRPGRHRLRRALDGRLPPVSAAPSRRRWWYVGSVLAFLLASAGKQSVLLLPAVMLVWDLLVERRRNWQMLADKVPFGLITLFFGWMTWHAQPSTNQALHPFVLAATQFTNLWLLTGLGQYVLYRPAPNPAAWGQPASLR